MPTNIWEILQAIGAVATPLVVAVIGGLITYRLHTARLAAERHRLEQELAVLRVQIASNMIPFLNSENPSQVRVALETISALGDVELAVNMAQVVREKSAVAALKSLASHPDCPDHHPESLGDLLSGLRSSVVLIETNEDGPTYNGLVLGAGIVSSSACRVASNKYLIRLPGLLYPSEATELDHSSSEYPDSVALVLTFSEEGYPAIPMAASNVTPLSRATRWPHDLTKVIVVGYSSAGRWTSLVGQPEPNYSGGPSGRLVAMDILSKPRDIRPGAPIITDDGTVVGLYLPDGNSPKFMDALDLGWLIGGPAPFPEQQD